MCKSSKMYKEHTKYKYQHPLIIADQDKMGKIGCVHF
jgi:hypothetical protein